MAVDHAHQVAVVGSGRPDRPFQHLAINELMGPGRANRDGRQRFFRRQAPVGHGGGSVDRRAGILRARHAVQSSPSSLPNSSSSSAIVGRTGRFRAA